MGEPKDNYTGSAASVVDALAGTDRYVVRWFTKEHPSALEVWDFFVVTPFRPSDSDGSVAMVRLQRVTLPLPNDLIDRLFWFEGSSHITQADASQRVALAESYGYNEIARAYFRLTTGGPELLDCARTALKKELRKGLDEKLDRELQKELDRN